MSEVTEAPSSAAVDTSAPIDTGATGAPDTGGDFGSLDDAMGSFFANSEQEPQAEELAPEAAPVPAPQAAAPPVPEAIDPLDEDADLKAIAAAPGKMKQVPAERFNGILQNHKFALQVQDFAPTVEAAREHYEAATDFKRVMADFGSGDPAGVEAVLGYLGQQAPKGITAMATAFPSLLAKSNPEAYNAMASHILTGVIEQNYTEAADSTDPQAFYRAQMFEWTQTGKYRQPGEAKPIDPLAEREAAIKAKEDQFRTQETQQQEAAVKQWQQGTYGHINQQIAGEIDGVLKPVEGKFTPRVMTALKNEIRTQIIATIQKDQTWTQNFDIDFKNGLDMRSEEARNALAQQYVSKVRNVIRSVAKPLVSEATQSVVTENQAVHNRAAKAAGKTAPVSSGRPSTVSARAAMPGASLQDTISGYLSQQ